MPRVAALRPLAHRLVEPHRSVTNGRDRQRVRLLSAILLALVVVTPASVLSQVPSADVPTSIALVSAVLTVGVAALYALSRTSAYRWAATISVWLTFAGAAYGVFGVSDAEVAPRMAFLVIPVGLAAFLAVARVAFAAAAAAVGAALVATHLIDGGQHLAEARTALLFVVLTSALLVVAAVLNSFERRQHENLEREYRRLFDSTFEGILIHEGGIIVEANEPLAELVGAASAEELRGRDVFDVVVFDDPALIRRMVALGGGDRRYQTGFHLHDGRHLDVEILGKAWTHAGRGVRYVVVRDVSELRQAVDALQRALEASGTGMWDYDIVRDTVAARNLAPLFGVDDGFFPCANDDLRALIAPESLAAIDARVETAATTGEDYEVELDVVRRPGARLWSRGRVFCDADGRRVRVTGITVDVSERVRLEDTLREAQRLEAVGRLAGGVAHDFNNLLTAIAGYGELLRAELPATDGRRDSVDEIVRAVERAAALTRQLLAFSRRQVLTPMLVDVREIVDGMRALLERLVGEDLVLRLVHPAALPLIRADRNQMEQVLLNLVVNARDAMPGGGVITISTFEDGGDVALSVRDTGCGMSDDVRERAFEPFFTTKPLGEGTGLGLATVHGVVAQSGGRIELDSAAGKGTTVTVRLPAAGGVSRCPAGDDGDGDDGECDGARRPRVLLVEDNDAVQRLAGAVLERAGYVVVQARDGEEAEEVWRTGPAIDVLLTDVVMPGRSGVELAHVLRAEQPGLAVLLTSGYADAALDGRPVPDRAVFLPKPFSAAELTGAVARALDA